MVSQDINLLWSVQSDDSAGQHAGVLVTAALGFTLSQQPFLNVPSVKASSPSIHQASEQAWECHAPHRNLAGHSIVAWCAATKCPPHTSPPPSHPPRSRAVAQQSTSTPYGNSGAVVSALCRACASKRLLASVQLKVRGKVHGTWPGADSPPEKACGGQPPLGTSMHSQRLLGLARDTWTCVVECLGASLLVCSAPQQQPSHQNHPATTC